MMKLVEEYSGEGELIRQGEVLHRVRYRISRYQGVLEQSGMPVPGVHRVEGSIDVGAARDLSRLIGEALTLKLQDGRAIGITLADAAGRVLAEGHGPSRCLCC